MSPALGHCDVNFCFPVKELQNAKVKLTPFIPFRHAEPFFTGTFEDSYDYLPWGPFDSSADFVDTVIIKRIQPDPGQVLFAVLDRTCVSDAEDIPPLAGIIGLLNTSLTNLSTEIGFVITLPAFRRTHVTSTAVSLLLEWCLESPEKGGLGMRRVQWQTNEMNVASARAAENMGFTLEGVIRWQRVLPEGKPGPMRSGEVKKPGRHTKMFSLCWDEWEGGVRDRILQTIRDVG